MARIVLISPYLKGGQNAAKLAQRTRYVATRPGVELLADERSTLPATKKDCSMRMHTRTGLETYFLRRNSQRNISENSSFVSGVVVCVVVAKKEVPQCMTT